MLLKSGKEDQNADIKVDIRNEGYDKSKFDIEKKNTICEIFKSKWTLEDDKLFYIIEGDRFLHHMVRYLVGTMIGYMEKKISTQEFLSLLANPRKDAKLLKAPANGLILNKIFYEK